MHDDDDNDNDDRWDDEEGHEERNKPYLQFGGGSSVISANSFWILQQWRENNA